MKPVCDLDTDEGKQNALERMMLIRSFEEKVGQLFQDGQLPGFVHKYVGQEATGIGACFALAEDDYITSTHRGHGHCLAKGLEPEKMMSELYGKLDGYNKGKGGSMHIADVGAGMLGANGIVGAGGFISTGAAVHAHIKDRDWAALCFSGDGAVVQGHFQESLNMAATWGLPVIYLIENNQYAEGTPFEEQHPTEDLQPMAACYGMEGVKVDGQDVEAVYDVVREAREAVASGEGPVFIESETYRFGGHYEGDPEPYRSRDEVEDWMENRDPIKLYREKLIADGVLTREEFDDLEDQLDRRMEEAVKHAEQAELPDLDEAYEDTFTEVTPDMEYFRTMMNPDPS